MATSLKLVFVGLMATACTRESVHVKADTTSSVQQIAVAPETTFVPAPSVESETASTTEAHLSVADSSAPSPLSCTPTTFSSGDTLTLWMWAPHGHYLTVTRSDRIAYFIVYPPVGKKPNYSVMPSDDFANLATLRLPSDVRAIPYVSGRDTILEPVFGEPGKYLLQMGDNMGTDYGTPPPNCKLTFLKGLQNCRGEMGRDLY
jgi:hypothetical protein